MKAVIRIVGIACLVFSIPLTILFSSAGAVTVGLIFMTLAFIFQGIFEFWNYFEKRNKDRLIPDRCPPQKPGPALFSSKTQSGLNEDENGVGN